MNDKQNELDYLQVCFDLAANGEYDSAIELMLSCQDRLASVAHRDEDQSLELCLPPPLASVARDQWLQRKAMLAANPVVALIGQVGRTVPFYRHAVAHKSTSDQSLDDFPLISRLEILENYDQFLSESLDSQQFKTFKRTSGTSGKQIIVWFDLASLYDISYAPYGYLATTVPDLLSTITPGRLAAVQVTDYPYSWRASTIVPSLGFGRLERRVFVGDPERDHRLVKEMRLDPPPLLCGMASSLALFAELDREIAPQTARIAPTAIFVSGENLFENERERLEQWFRCPILNGYASTEGGLIALECNHRKGLHVLEDRVLLEILGPDGKLCGEGCGEIVLTNFMNWAVPFIRYRTGDIATIRKETCACGFAGLTLTELLGREAQQFTAADRSINPRVLDAQLTRLPIRHFVVTQEADGQFAVNWRPATPEISSEVVELAIADVIREHLGKVELKVNRLEPLSSPARKAKRYIKQ